jgi:hypothetical protein
MAASIPKNFKQSLTMANQLPPPGQVVLRPKHRTFRALYQDASADPYQGRYERIMERFDPERNNAISHVMLLEQAGGAGAIPQAYLCCMQRQNQTRLFCVHMFSR